MGQLTITLSDELENEVRTIVRAGRYGSVSDFVRDAIQGELSHRPTYWERFIAVQVLENNKMLKQQIKDPEWGSDELLEALKRGYTSDYAEAESLVYHDELTKEGIDFVHEVLGMFGQLQHGYDVYGNNDKELGEAVLFEGFDANAGDGYLGYTSFLVDNGKYTYIRPLDKTPHLNSHDGSTVDTYKRMLDEFKAVRAAHDKHKYEPLTLEEVKRIVASQTHPENR